MYIRTRTFKNFKGLGGSGSMQWYIGQHSKVRSALQNGDLKAAIEAGAALNDLGIEGKKYEDVVASKDLLQAFKDAILIKHAPAGFYKDVAATVGPLIDKAIGELRPPTWLDGRWVCDPKQKPKSTGDEQYYCCPSGWVKSTFNDPVPCLKEKDIFDCGPLPYGATTATHACCTRIKEWLPKVDANGQDPCRPYNLKASEILAPDIVIPQERSIFTPGMLLAGAAAIGLMITLTLVM